MYKKKKKQLGAWFLRNIHDMRSPKWLRSKARLWSVGLNADDRISTHSWYFCMPHPRFQSCDPPWPSSVWMIHYRSSHDTSHKKKNWAYTHLTLTLLSLFLSFFFLFFFFIFLFFCLSFFLCACVCNKFLNQNRFLLCIPFCLCFWKRFLVVTAWWKYGKHKKRCVFIFFWCIRISLLAITLWWKCRKRKNKMCSYSLLAFAYL